MLRVTNLVTSPAVSTPSWSTRCSARNGVTVCRYKSRWFLEAALSHQVAVVSLQQLFLGRLRHRWHGSCQHADPDQIIDQPDEGLLGRPCLMTLSASPLEADELVQNVRTELRGSQPSVCKEPAQLADERHLPYDHPRVMTTLREQLGHLRRPRRQWPFDHHCHHSSSRDSWRRSFRPLRRTAIMREFRSPLHGSDQPRRGTSDVHAAYSATPHKRLRWTTGCWVAGSTRPAALAPGVGLRHGAGVLPAHVRAPGAEDGPAAPGSSPRRGVRVLRRRPAAASSATTSRPGYQP